jgi:hypothetical protein
VIAVLDVKEAGIHELQGKRHISKAGNQNDRPTKNEKRKESYFYFIARG